METLTIAVMPRKSWLFSTLKKTLTGQSADHEDFNTIVACRYGDVNIRFSYTYMVRLGEYIDAGIFMYDVSERDSFERAIRVINDIREQLPEAAILLLAVRDPGSSVEVAGEDGAREAAKLRCMFAEVEPNNREEALAGIIRFVEEIIERKREKERRKLEAEAYKCGIKPEVFRSLKSGDTNTDEILKLGFEENYHVRVMVVGKEGVGKSTLTRRLIQLPVAIKQYNSTDGIEVHIRRCEIDLDSGTWSTKTRLSHEEKSFLQKFKGILKRRKKTKEESQHAATEVSRDYHERLAKVFQSADLPETLIETDEHMGDDSSVALSPQISTEPKQTKSELGGETQIQQGGGLPELPPEANKDANTLTPKMSISKVDIEKSLKKALASRSEENRKKAKVTFYDFAGQDIYHSSHPTFLDSSSIYIMVYDLRKTYEWQIKKLPINALGEYMKTLLHWLHVIYTIDSKLPVIRPHVLLVGTHADKLPKKCRHDIIERSFDGFREYLVDFPFNIILAKSEFAVDNTMKNDPVYDGIKSTILQLAKLQPNWGHKTPAKWMPLDRKLELLKDSGEKVISLENLRDINSSLEVNLSNEQEIASFLEFLHSNGEIIYFKEEGLENTIILDPVWMIDALKTIITAEEFAKRTHHLNKLWNDFRESGIIAKSAIVSIFKENDKDSSFFKNHEHLIRLMEKFMFIASPVRFPEEEGAGIGTDVVLTEDQADVLYIMPCMVNQAPDQNLLTKKEGLSSTSVLCVIPVSYFLPPAVFHKVLAMCIAQWPIVEQNGRKLIFPSICIFNYDKERLYKIQVFHVQNGIHMRIISFEDEEHPTHAVCGPVMKFLIQSVKRVLESMGFPSDIKHFIQCPQISATSQSGLLDLDAMEKKSIVCNHHPESHVLHTKQLLYSWTGSDHGREATASQPESSCLLETLDEEDAAVTDKNIGMPDSSRSYFKKPDDDTLSEAKISQYEKAMKSVGILFAFENQIGTVFRVGSKYVMTAFHCYLQIIDPMKNGAIKLDNLKHPSVLVKFEYPQYNNPNPIVFQIQNVTYTNKQFDIAILELNDPAARLPPPLKLYEHELSVMTLRYVDIIGYGHPNSDKKQLDPACKTLLPQGSEIQFAKEWVRDNKAKLKHYVKPGIDSSCVERGYEGYDRKENILFSCWLEHGASGAPILTTKCSDSPVVVGVVTKGLPFWYWDLTSDGQFYFRNEYRFEVGTKMAHIARDIASSNYVLGCDLFK